MHLQNQVLDTIRMFFLESIQQRPLNGLNLNCFVCHIQVTNECWPCLLVFYVLWMNPVRWSVLSNTRLFLHTILMNLLTLGLNYSEKIRTNKFSLNETFRLYCLVYYAFGLTFFTGFFQRIENRIFLITFYKIESIFLSFLEKLHFFDHLQKRENL